MTKKNILVIEDEENIQELITYNLKKEGWQVTAVSTAEDALSWLSGTRPDCILLDIMLPGMNGLELCKELKRNKETRQIPVIMVTAKGEEVDVVIGLELGADDYLTKPFSPRVLIARIKAVLRRGTEGVAAEGASELIIDELRIHPGKREISISGSSVELTYSEFGILHLLALKPGWVYTRNQIVDGIRGDNYIVTDRSVDVIIVSLRKKLGAGGKYIETVRGIGYRFKKIG
jgi:two-component system phosphate regulon response regulator PhoB